MKPSVLLILSALVILALFLTSCASSNSLRNIHIQKKIKIAANEQEVFDMVKYLQNFPKWSPFLAADPDQQYKVTGQDGQIGAKYHWEGNEGKDMGYQEIVQIEELRTIKMQCDIQKPFEAHPTFTYSFEKEDDGVIVTQDFRLTNGRMDAFFMWLFGAKGKMEATNEKGMEMLKVAIEG